MAHFADRGGKHCSTRREFVLGIAAAAGLPPWAMGASAAPLLRLGVLSDVHIREDAIGTSAVQKAFGLFRERGVDGVVICGDLADNGRVAEMEALAKCWFDVFPGDVGADGKKVKRLFIYGNHDHEGWKYNSKYRKTGPDGKSVPSEGCLIDDYAGCWERIWCEPWKPVRMEEVNGYRVVLQHFNGWGGVNPAVKFLEDRRAELVGDKPFFYVQHVHPRNTCAGSEEGDRQIRAALNAFPNAIALTGHSHRTIWREECFWHGEFVSVECGCAKFVITEDGRENSFPRPRKGSLTPCLKTHDGRCAEYVELLADELRIERWDLSSMDQVGAPWRAPLPLRPVEGPEDNPARWPSRMPLAAPQFAAGAKGRVELSGDAGLVSVCFPPAASGRAHDYRVTIVVDGKEVLERRVFAPQFYRAPSVPRALCTCVFSRDELPSAGARFEVRPVAENGREGAPLLIGFS